MDQRASHLIVAAGILIAFAAIISFVGLLSTDRILAQADEPEHAESGGLWTRPAPPSSVSSTFRAQADLFVLTLAPNPLVERREMSTEKYASDGPRPHVTTSGPAGTPASFRLPPSARPKYVGIAAIQSTNDWTPDFVEDFEDGIDPSTWLTVDQSDDGAERFWGADDFRVNSGDQSAWVAAGGADGVDPELYYYPHNLDAWLITNRHFDLSDVQMADAEFTMYLDTEPQDDYVFVGASVDGEDFYGESWTGFSGGWQSFNLDLSDFIGYQQVQLAWYFHSDGDNWGGLEYDGVWLDDVTVWTYEDTGPPQSDESIQNGDFETGDLTGWVAPPGSTVIVTEATNPVSGDYVAYFGGIPNADELLYQPITVPDSDVTSARFGFWINEFGTEIAAGADLFCAGLYDSELDDLLLDLGCLDGVDASTSALDPDPWWQVDYHLTGEEWNAIKGQTVNVVFEMQTDGSLNTTILVDDVTFEVVTGGSTGDAYEPNDSRAEATAATLGTVMSDLTIDPDGDYDYFSLSGDAGDTAVVDIDAAVNGSALDSYVWLLDSSGDVVCENDDDGYTLDSYLSCELISGGTHYVVVTSYDGSGDRSYAYTLLVDVSGSGEPSPTPPPTPEPTPEPTPPPGGTKDWTAILYLDGDNNLCDSYPYLITRMEDELGAKLSSFLNVVVLFDRDPRYCSSGGTTRYLVQPGSNYTDGTNRWDMGELNMGDPQTLVNFATWAMRNYPAEHYYLAIDNHGGGISGVAWDDTDSHDNITNDELYTALKEITQNGSRRLDVFAYEACLMGMYENAYDIREFTDYVFFFPTISWTNNASYPSYLGHSNFTASTTGRELGEIIFDVYYAAVTNPYALSLIDSSKMAAVQAAVDDWADALSASVGTTKNGMTSARSNAQKIDTNGDDLLTDQDNYIDLWDLADEMAARGIAATEAADVKAAVDEATVRSDQRSRGTLNYTNIHGLSIYWPQTASGAYSAYVGDRVYNSTRDGRWDEFLEDYFGGSERGGMPTDPGPTERRPDAGMGNNVYLPLVGRRF